MSRTLPQAVQATHEVLRWVIPVLDGFPRNRRFTLGERIEARLLDVLELLIAATYTRGNGRSLKAANRKLAVLRHFWRTAHGRRILASNPYRDCSERFALIGHSICGWKKNRRQRVNRKEIAFSLAFASMRCASQSGADCAGSDESAHSNNSLYMNKKTCADE